MAFFFKSKHFANQAPISLAKGSPIEPRVVTEWFLNISDLITDFKSRIKVTGKYNILVLKLNICLIKAGFNNDKGFSINIVVELFSKGPKRA